MMPNAFINTKCEKFQGCHFDKPRLFGTRHAIPDEGKIYRKHERFQEYYGTEYFSY